MNSRVLFLFVLLACARGADAQTESYFNGDASGVYAFTNATRWSDGVPGADATAWYTNSKSYTVTNAAGLSATNANAYFDATAQAVALDFRAGGPYWVTNVFGIGHSSFSTAGVNWAGGILLVTNAAHTATLYVGEGRKGSLTLGGGTIVADRLIATNGLNGADATLAFNGGSLQTREAEIRQPSLGNWSGGSWTASGGTNRFLTGGVFWRFRGAGENSARLVVTGNGTVWTNDATLLLGDAVNDSSRFIVSNGAKAYSSGGVTIGNLNNTVLTQSLILVSGTGAFWSSSGDFKISAAAGGDNRLTVNEGGAASFSGGNGSFIGSGVGSTGRVDITGAGSLVVFNHGLYVGSNSGSSYSKGVGTILVENGGTLEMGGALYAGEGGSGLITNHGGVYQWTLRNPAITTNSPNSIILSDGTVSFRGMTNANVLVDLKITFLGANAFRLNNASNWLAAGNPGSQDYTFDSTLGAANYARLEMINEGTAWWSKRLSIGGGGSLLVSNSSASIRAEAITNLGAVTVVNSRVRWQGNTVLGGAYVSDPSTNTFESNLTVTASGALSGGSGDQFVFYRDLVNGSTNRSQFNLAFASVLFTNGADATNHVLNLAGSGALDLGSNWISVIQLATNFAFGTLSLAAGNALSLTGGVANALYVGTLDLQGLADTNDLASRLWLGINLYYDPSQPGNTYLNGLSYDLPGAGWLIPIPEPSAFLAVGAGLALLAFLRRRR
ncbi:MAG: PEP-CTERM sorting domain-containing protein [Verrucomicrobiae bacterium]|nr:PEP-CTERM sorting domain-containing protein [Verrucomicrobiae bacterium]